MTPRHPCTGKSRFGSWDEAHQVLVEAKIKAALRGNPRRREQRAYYCGNCNGWHLTSQPDSRRNTA